MDTQGGGGGAGATNSHTGAGILAPLSCTSGRKHFIDCYSESSYTPPSSEKSSNDRISSWYRKIPPYVPPRATLWSGGSEICLACFKCSRHFLFSLLKWLAAIILILTCPSQASKSSTLSHPLKDDDLGKISLLIEGVSSNIWILLHIKLTDSYYAATCHETREQRSWKVLTLVT